MKIERKTMGNIYPTVYSFTPENEEESLAIHKLYEDLRGYNGKLEDLAMRVRGSLVERLDLKFTRGDSQ
jgi:hypothetical protein